MWKTSKVSLTAYLVGKYEVRDYEHSYDVPYNKKYENRYFAIPISDREKGFFNLTTIFAIMIWAIMK